MSRDPEALRLIGDYLPLARRTARRWQSRFPEGDIEAAMAQALYLAAFTYRPGKGGFAWWFGRKARGQMVRFIRWRARHAALILPASAKSPFWTHGRVLGTSRQHCGTSSRGGVRRGIPAAYGEDTTPLDLLPDDSHPPPIERFDLPVLLDRLDDRARECVRLRYWEDLGFEEIGSRVGLTDVWVGRIIAAALAKMRDAGDGRAVPIPDAGMPTWRVRQSLARQAKRDRDAAILDLAGTVTAKEIAARLGCHVETVVTTLRKAGLSPRGRWPKDAGEMAR